MPVNRLLRSTQTRDRSRICNNMAANVDLATAIALLVQAINGMPRAAPPPPWGFNPFASTDVVDLSSRSGALAYTIISALLDNIWDGDTSTFPSFVVSLRIRAKEGKWDASSTMNTTTGVIPLILQASLTYLMRIFLQNTILLLTLKLWTSPLLASMIDQPKTPKPYSHVLNLPLKEISKTQSSRNSAISLHMKMELSYSKNYNLHVRVLPSTLHDVT